MTTLLALQGLDLPATAARLVQELHVVARLADVGVHLAAAWWIWRR